MRNPSESHLRRWGRRAGYAVGLLIVLIVGLWGWLQYDSSRKLQAVIDAARARDEPILAVDLKLPSLPDAQNAAPLLLRAAAPLAKLNERETEVMLSANGHSFGLTADEADAVAASVLEAHPDVLKLLAAARDKPGVAWPVKPAAQVLETDMSYLGTCRWLTEFCVNVARYRHRHGDDGAAVQRLRDGASAGRTADASPLLVSHLVAVACDSLVSEATLEIAPTLTIGEGEPGATPEQVRALMADLLEDRGRRADFKRALLEDKLAVLDSMDAGSRNNSYGGLIGFFWRYNAVHAAELMDASVAAAAKPDWPAAQAALKPWVVTGRSPRFRMLGDMLFPSVRLSIKSSYRAAATRRVAATMLAIRLYQRDHDGRRPAALADLVPGYLPALPGDPFAADGRTFGYAPAGPDARLWSVGINATDDGGALPAGKPTSRTEGGAPWDFPDAAFPLDPHARWSDPPPPARPG